MKIYRDVANEPVCYEVPILPDYSGMRLFDNKIRSFLLTPVKNGTSAPVSTDQIIPQPSDTLGYRQIRGARKGNRT